MKKNVRLAALWAAVIVGFYSLAYGAQTCARTDMYCYESGPTGNLSTIGRLDSSGNLSLNGNTVLGSGAGVSTGGVGNLSYGGISVYTPQSVTVSSCSTIVPTSTYIQVVSSGSTLLMGNCATPGAPIISTATAIAGQYVILYDTSSAGAITLSSGTASGIVGTSSNAPFVLSNTGTISFIFDAVTQMWREIAR